MTIEKNPLVAYSMAFASFLVDSKISGKIDRIILFGSVARGDFTEESDIDIFIDTDSDIEKEVYKLVALFNESKVRGIWKLKGLRNEISVKVGKLDMWSLKRNVISSGILLYGKFKEIPETVEYYLLVRLDMKGINPNKQMTIWRTLYGYKQKIGKKLYVGEGLIKKLGGEKIGKAVFLVPMGNRGQIVELLKKNKIKHTVNELWSDAF